MNNHDYALKVLEKVIAELEKAGKASIMGVELMAISGQYTDEEKDRIINCMLALCHVQDDYISKIVCEELLKTDISSKDNGSPIN